jgi:CheY-like chemotaxis protein
MDSILHNLLSNAMKYTPEGGQVKVTLQGNSTYWTVDISDTGIGIPASDQKKMFKQLFRGQNAINQRITGTGIGMLQIYRLVKLHLGRITGDSVEDQGTTFHLRFPMKHRKYIQHAATLTERPTMEPVDMPTGSICVAEGPQTAPSLLIVEDNPELRHFLCRSLSETYRITEAQNGQEATLSLSLQGDGMYE